MKIIMRNLQTNDLYKQINNLTFENIRTGKQGEVKEETASKVFRINVEAMELINRYPNLEVLINKLNLKIDNINNSI